MYAVRRSTTSVSIISHSQLLRETVGTWLRLQRGIGRVVVAGSLSELVSRLAGRASDVLLLHASVDTALSDGLICAARMLLPATRLIVLQPPCSEREVSRWTEAEAEVCLQETASAAELLQAIFRAGRGRPLGSRPWDSRVFFGRWPKCPGGGVAYIGSNPGFGQECDVEAASLSAAGMMDQPAGRIFRILTDLIASLDDNFRVSSVSCGMFIELVKVATVLEFE